ncbi:phosphinothricin acetyltransferase [Burkholderiaceae bacterium]|nr:phosphinothricin acetyltransferase [Burkholderiaceae bacterium]
MNDAPVERALLPADRPAFTRLMAAAFANDPLFVDMFGHDDTPQGRSAARRQAFFDFLFDKCTISRDTLRGSFAAGRLVACVIVEEGSRRPPLLRIALRFLRLLPKLPLRASKLLNDYMRVTRREAPRVRHHYLTMIGVDPSMQGRGIGSRLVREVIARARSAGMEAVALDTENADNVGRYEKLGFRETGRVCVGRTTAYCMVLSLRS